MKIYKDVFSGKSLPYAHKKLFLMPDSARATRMSTTLVH